MTYQSTTTVILDPVKEADIMALYEKDTGWLKKGDSTIAVVFECKSPLFIPDKAFYLPNNKPENDYKVVREEDTGVRE